MNIHRRSLYFLRITTDIIILFISFFIAMEFSIREGSYRIDINNQVLFYLIIVAWLISTKVTGLYDEFRSRNFTFELSALIKNVFVLSLASIVVLFLLEKQILSRTFVILFSFYSLILLIIEKYVFRLSLRMLRKKGRNLRSILIVGGGDVGYNFYESIKNNPHFGYYILGFLDDEKKDYLNGEYLGKISDLDNVLEEKNVDDVIIALPHYAESKLVEVVRTCERHTTRIKIIPNYFKLLSGKYDASMFGRFPIISVREDKLNELHWRIAKRTFDLTFSICVFLFVFSWLWPLIGLAIKITSKGPVFYKQIRWGRDNKRFVTYKFRSMKMEETSGKEEFKQATKDDPRITKIGKFLRKSNLDELPQFWNVLMGDMSIVGPRPHPTPLNMESKDKIKLYMLRHLVKPGITGWAQANGYRGETKKDGLMQKRIDHDIWYIEHWSFTLDLQIVFLTVWNMIKGDPNAY